MVMADGENSDFAANAAAQELIRGPPQFRYPDIARCKTPLRALESQRARTSQLSRQCPNRPSDEGQATSASAASTICFCFVLFLFL
jgi:hypothetical protein